jgi:hypothetical protein
MIDVVTILGAMFGIVAIIDFHTINRLPRWVQWIGSICMGASLVFMTWHDSSPR